MSDDIIGFIDRAENGDCDDSDDSQADKAPTTVDILTTS